MKVDTLEIPALKLTVIKLLLYTEAGKSTNCSILKQMVNDGRNK